MLGNGMEDCKIQASLIKMMSNITIYDVDLRLQKSPNCTALVEEIRCIKRGKGDC